MKIPITPSKNHPFGSHQAVLEAVTSSPLVGNRILEFGIGHYSTGYFYSKAITGENGILITFETDIKYIGQFKIHEDDHFQIVHVRDWDDELKNNDLFNEHWNIVFVDQHPYQARIDTIERLKNNCDYLILHDAIHLIGYPTKVKEYTDFFKYVQEYPIGESDPRTFPNTIIGSNFYKCNFNI